MPYGSSCPNCTHDTFPLVSTPLRVLRQLIPRFSLERRWCPVCEWDGYAHARAPLAMQAIPLGPSAHRMQELRTLEIGGRAWNVRLESWLEAGRVYGRLVFVGPSGKLWSDPSAAFSASTQNEVLSQALSLSDRLLAYRLREVISG